MLHLSTGEVAKETMETDIGQPIQFELLNWNINEARPKGKTRKRKTRTNI